MKKGLLRFCFAALVVFASVVVIDMVVGKITDFMLSQISNQGDTGKTYYSLNDVSTPVVIVGSSRAVNHYNTQMIEDSLCIPTYNVGRSACFFSYNCCVVNSILDRYTPKLIIWENEITELYAGIRDPLQHMYPYYGSNSWGKQFIDEDLLWSERVKLNCRIYRYNSVIPRIAGRYLGRKSFVDEKEKGYEPLAPKKLKQKLELKQEEYDYTELSKTKIDRFQAILERAHKMGVKMVIVDSPKYYLYDQNNLSATKIKEMCNQYGVLFLDNSQLPELLAHVEYFNDYKHMNTIGATVYTKLFIKQISEYVKAE